MKHQYNFDNGPSALWGIAVFILILWACMWIGDNLVNRSDSYGAPSIDEVNGASSDNGAFGGM